MIIPNKGDLLYSKPLQHIALVVGRDGDTVKLRSLHCPNDNLVVTHNINHLRFQSSVILVGNINSLELKIGHMLRTGT